MPYKLKIDRNIAPEKNALQKWCDSPVGYWKVTTEGDVEGHSTTQLGTHYGHIVEIALSLKGCYSLRFEKAKEPSGVYGSPEDHHKIRKIVAKSTNISILCWSHKGGEKELSAWLDCPEIVVKPCNYYGAYTIVLKD